MSVRYNSQNFGYSRSIADRQRRRFLLGAGLIGIFLLVVMGAVGYWIIGSDFFKITEIKAEGIEKVNKEEFLLKLDELKKKKFLGLIPVDDNVVFFNSGDIQAQIASAFPIFQEVTVVKDLPNRVLISVVERNPKGVWCFGVLPEQECRYFDQSGSTWGQALRSTGTLLMTIEDEVSPHNQKKIDETRIQTIEKIYATLGELGVNIKRILIPQGTLNELRVYTSRNYYILFSLDKSIEDQLSAFEIFITQRASRDYEYIDLRVKDRVYFK